MSSHNFHIPVMGVAYTIDSPLRVSQYGIDSVISLVDNVLLEKLRKVYSEQFNIPYQEISEKAEDYMAKRITSYLNLINRLSIDKMESVKHNLEDKKTEILDYFEMLPDTSDIKKEFKRMYGKFSLSEMKDWLKTHMTMGSVDVNIMTKVDKDNYKNGEKLPQQYNDAHAALRGYANSDLDSKLILSAGMSPRLYSYIEQFKDFYPDTDGYIKKRVVLKVSDYRSAIIQGKFLAKKGLWVSEYRVESGLNCGGHAFATDGFLMGPILEEFKKHRNELKTQVFDIYAKALEQKEYDVPKNIPELEITAQGGVGTAEEHDFLLNYYEIDSVGWGSPFLLVPEATTVDDYTINELAKAGEDDLYLSNISPLGVPFNSLRTASATQKKLVKAQKGRAGSACPKGYLAYNKEYTEIPICTASRQYQHKKLKELDTLDLPKDAYQKQYNKIIAPECLCVGLSEPAIITHQIDYKIKDNGVTVCPGPNMAYFSKIVSLKKMVKHIYGKTCLIADKYRPNMFVKELDLYLDYLKNQLDDTTEQIDQRQQKYFEKFAGNLETGIAYYKDLFDNTKDKFADKKDKIYNDLEKSKQKLTGLFDRIRGFSVAPK